MIQLSLCLEFCSAMIASLKKRETKKQIEVLTWVNVLTHIILFMESLWISICYSIIK